MTEDSKLSIVSAKCKFQMIEVCDYCGEEYGTIMCGSTEHDKQNHNAVDHLFSIIDPTTCINNCGGSQ